MDRAALVLMALICTAVIVAAMLGAVWIVDRLTTKVELEVRPPDSSASSSSGPGPNWELPAELPPTGRSATVTDVTRRPDRQLSSPNARITAGQRRYDRQ